ncbi:membrane protein insertase YidC [Streptomyces sp. NPDC008001]|uniref:membrane protein insertase YidC n=1 Tax=Streptomyces sp. NPDC008001 TaxID=3364804 RepID=UPI0036EC21CD
MLDSMTGVCYTLVHHLSTWLTPAFGQAATAAAVVLATVLIHIVLHPLARREIKGERTRAQILPHIQQLAAQHRGNPRAFRAAVTRLRKEKNISPYAGLGPALLQFPILVVLLNLFMASTISGHPNELLHEQLAGTPMGAYWIGALSTGYTSRQTFVFTALTLLTILACWLASIDAKKRASSSPNPLPIHTARLLRLTPFIPALFLVVTPLAASLYTLVSTIWVTGERWLLRRRYAPAQAEQPAPAHTAEMRRSG